MYQRSLSGIASDRHTTRLDSGNLSLISISSSIFYTHILLDFTCKYSAKNNTKTSS
uniref:Uncharacterized protein n=1 Tax=Myoviridae sp. ct04y17 TaxID=2827652 RepID=A0A8S5SIA2_9CAUD|nr:MAG TPA: hypothetical protein [Myoviridae sp. ct04y17]